MRASHRKILTRGVRRRPMHMSLSAVGDSAWDNTPRTSELAEHATALPKAARAEPHAEDDTSTVVISPVSLMPGCSRLLAGSAAAEAPRAAPSAAGVSVTLCPSNAAHGEHSSLRRWSRQVHARIRCCRASCDMQWALCRAWRSRCSARIAGASPTWCACSLRREASRKLPRLPGGPATRETSSGSTGWGTTCLRSQPRPAAGEGHPLRWQRMHGSRRCTRTGERALSWASIMTRSLQAAGGSDAWHPLLPAS